MTQLHPLLETQLNRCFPFGLPKCSGLQQFIEAVHQSYRSLERQQAANVSHAQTDVTNLKERKRELERLSLVASANTNGVVFTDAKGRIYWANEGYFNLTGYTSEDLLGKRPTDLARGPLSDAAVIRKMVNAYIQGKNFAIEVLYYRKNGTCFWARVKGQVIPDEEGNITQYFSIIEDITLEKEQEKELIEARKKAEESSKAKEEFLANMSHEIRTPLNAIIGMVRELTKEQVTTRQQTYIRNAGAASQHLLSIVNNILDMSKIEAGEFMLESRHFSLSNVIDETVSIVSTHAHEKLLKLKVTVARDIESAYIGDPSRIRQVLINLLGNAIKFTDKGHVAVRCNVIKKGDGRQVVSISVSDTGIGMEQSYIQNLFKKFNQEDVSTARKYGGTGLGMAITHELIQLMGGTIDVISEKGKGTRITLQLPLECGDAAQIEDTVAPHNFHVLRGLKLLLVEDNAVNRLVAINTLKYFGVVVTEAENGLIALEKMKGNFYDIILMDLHMPEMDGIETTRIIRKHFLSGTPIIALSANAFRKEIDQCLAAGMNDYVTKPFEEQALLQAIIRNTAPKSPGTEKDQQMIFSWQKAAEAPSLLSKQA